MSFYTWENTGREPSVRLTANTLLQRCETARKAGPSSRTREAGMRHILLPFRAAVGRGLPHR